jgi:hypothetical protein
MKAHAQKTIVIAGKYVCGRLSYSKKEQDRKFNKAFYLPQRPSHSH